MEIRRFIKFEFLLFIYIFFGFSNIIFGARTTVMGLFVNKTRNQMMSPPSFDILVFAAGIITDSLFFFFFIF